jgi:glucose/arabinose dehydrogenase
VVRSVRRIADFDSLDLDGKASKMLTVSLSRPIARTLSLVAAFCFVIAGLTACGGDSRGGTNKSPSGSGQAQASAGGGDEPFEQVPLDEKRDWGKKVVWFEKLLERYDKKKPFFLDVPHTSVFIQQVPEENKFFMLGRNGDVHEYDAPLSSMPVRSKKEAKKNVPRWPGKIKKIKLRDTYASGDMGSIGFALDPDYLNNRMLYIWWVDKPDTTLYLDRYTWKGSAKEIEASKVNIISFSRSDPPAPYHMGGICQFLPDGTLILSPGDAERPELAQDPMNLNGKFLRIRPKTGSEGGYDIPEDNPFIGREGYRPEILALGLRAPFRAYLHEGEQLIFGDVGSVYEEINVWTKGRTNFSWGRTELVKGGITDGPKHVAPGDTGPLIYWDDKINAQYAAEDPEYRGAVRKSAGVGLIYDHPRDRYQGNLTGKLIFFDIMRGWMRAGTWNGPDGPFEHKHFGHREFISHMVVGDDGYIYLSTWGGGTSLWRMRSPFER